MKISSKIEDYLETIYRLSKEMDTVGVTDVAKARNVSVPTARTAVNRLQEYGFLHQKHYGKIILHEAGKKKGEEIYRVHKTLRRFLRDFLLVDEDTAEKEACKMEHGLSHETLERLQIFLRTLEESEVCEKRCMNKYEESLKHLNLENAGSEGTKSSDSSSQRELKTMTLLDLKPGETGIISKVGGYGKLRHRILDLGLHVGERIAMVKTAPLKDPIEFSLNGNHISLRRTEAELIQIKSNG
ncbi:MAG TPA: metal-dependent transcriptional regulator [candidate division Zixibacteria bacterium]|nr:metal-dependent transcriptional regulator [candidate division Zixibacteria bacterium]HER00012.1 metal-dependent transcriptional regulator [candidate division Zixibacteria bacterium]